MANRYEHPKGSELPLIAVEARPVFGTELFDKKLAVAVNGKLDIDPNFDAKVDDPSHVGMSNAACQTIVELPKKVTLTVGEHGSVTIKIAGVVVSSLPETVPYDTLVEFDAVPAVGYVVDTWSGLPQGTQSSGNDRWFSMGHDAVNVSVSFKEDIGTPYLKFEGPAATFTEFTLGHGANVEISDDGLTWSLYDLQQRAVNNGVVYVRAKSGSSMVRQFMGDFTKVSGNVMSLVDYENIATAEMHSNQFGESYDDGGLFDSCTALVDASGIKLPSSIAFECYYKMFYNCSSLVYAPEFPATSLAEACYAYVFMGCNNLTGPIVIDAASPYYTGTTSACEDMFRGAGTAEGAGGVIKVGGSLSAWEQAAAIGTSWTVQLIES